MRILPIAAILALIGSAAVAQTHAPKGDAPKAYIGAYRSDAPDQPLGGPAPEVDAGPGSDIVGPDGISTKVVKTVPCTTAAQETDGTTTCIGLPDPTSGARAGNTLEGTTTGMSRR